MRELFRLLRNIEHIDFYGIGIGAGLIVVGLALGIEYAKYNWGVILGGACITPGIISFVLGLERNNRLIKRYRRRNPHSKNDH